MDKFNHVDKILDFAIAEEEAANRFYLDLAGRSNNPQARNMFESFAKEELGHKAKLEDIKNSKALPPSEDVADLKISDYVVAAKPGPDMNFQDCLVIAMKKEKAAFRLYSHLAATTEDESLRKTFLFLAQEEAKHKLRFEIEYDDVILKEN